MVPFDKDTVLEVQTEVKPVKEPEAEKSREHRDLEIALGITLRADQLDIAREFLRLRQCDCTATRADFLTRWDRVPTRREEFKIRP